MTECPPTRRSIGRYCVAAFLASISGCAALRGGTERPSATQNASDTPSPTASATTATVHNTDLTVENWMSERVTVSVAITPFDEGTAEFRDEFTLAKRSKSEENDREVENIEAMDDAATIHVSVSGGAERSYEWSGDEGDGSKGLTAILAADGTIEFHESIR